MEDKIESSYSVISYPAFQLPETYRNMIFSKWLRSLRYGNDYFKLINSDDYYETYNKVIVNILKNPSAVVRIAVLTDAPDVVLGWSVHRGPILDFVHVHKDMRKQGIGTALLPKDITNITHVTKTGIAVWASKYPQFIFNPFS
jgi:GNAT superfamily N-acetyltransferase